VNPFDAFVDDLPSNTRESVKSASETKVVSRRETLARVFPDPAEARRQAAAIKAFVLDNLKALLIQLEAGCQANGIQVHWAEDAAKARELIPQYAKAIVDEVVSLSLDPEKFIETLRREVEARRAS